MNKAKIIQATIWSAVEIFLRNGVSFLVIVLLMRMIEPEAFGIVAMLAIFVSVASLFVDGGLSKALIQRQTVSHTDESSVFFLNLLLGFIVALLFCFAAPWIAAFYHQPVLIEITYAMSLGLFINAFSSVHIALLSKNLDFKLIAKVGTAASAISGVIAIAAAYKGLGVWSLVLQSLSSSLLTAVMLWILHPWRPGWVFSLQSIRSFWGFSSYLMLSGFLYRIYDNVFVMMIGYAHSGSQVGFYNQARKFQELPVRSFTGIISRIAFPVFSSFNHDKDILVKGLKKALALAVFMSVPLTIVLLLLSDAIILTLVGEKWLPSSPVLQMLSLATLLAPVQMLNINMLKALGRADLNFWIMAGKLILSIVCLWFVLPYGIVVIAITYTLLAFINVFINAHYTKRFLDYGVWKQLKDILPYVLAGVPMALIIIGIKAMFHLPVQMELLVAVSIGGLGYLLICWYAKLEAFEALLKIASKDKKREI